MRLSLTGYLLVALILSALANGVLAWRLAGASQRCRAEMESAARIAITNEQKRAAGAERKATDIAAETKKEGREDAAASEIETNDRETAIRTVVLHGDCRMPVGLPSLQPAIDAANAAARD